MTQKQSRTRPSAKFNRHQRVSQDRVLGRDVGVRDNGRRLFGKMYRRSAVALKFLFPVTPWLGTLLEIEIV